MKWLYYYIVVLVELFVSNTGFKKARDWSRYAYEIRMQYLIIITSTTFPILQIAAFAYFINFNSFT